MSRLWVAVVFFLGSAFAVSQPLDASRIASVDANVTEILAGFGLVDNLVAVDVTSQSLVTEKNLPDLGYHRALSVEGILSSEPTLVIGSNHMGPANVVDTLNNTDIPVLQLTAAESIDGLISNIQTLGRELGAEAQATQLVERLNGQADHLQTNPQDSPLTMVFLLNMSGRGLSKAGAGTTGAALIHLLGGENASDYGGYKSVSVEALLELNPDVILVGNSGDGSDAAIELLEQNSLLALSKAVQSERLLSVDASKMVAGVSLGVVAEAVRLKQRID
jgi:iron complex transport system substrate-binding protein